jgi:hypothetical protein
VFVLPSLHLYHQVVDELIDAGQSVWLFLPLEMAVIALAAFVVKTNHPLAIDDKHRPVFIVVRAWRDWCRKTPDHQFKDVAFWRDVFETRDESGLSCCQQCQRRQPMSMMPTHDHSRLPQNRCRALACHTPAPVTGV